MKNLTLPLSGFRRHFENRFHRRLSSFVLGDRIDGPLEFFGASSYELLDGVPTSKCKHDDRSIDSQSPSAQLREQEQLEGAAFDTIVVEASDGKLYHADDNDDSWCFSVAFAGNNASDLGTSDETTAADNDDNDYKKNTGDGECDDAVAINPSITLVMKLQKGDGSGEAWFRIHERIIGNSETKRCFRDHKIIAGQSKKQPWEELKPLLQEGANDVTFCCLCQENVMIGEQNKTQPWEVLKPLLHEGANHAALCCLRQHPNEEESSNLNGDPDTSKAVTKTTLHFARSSIWLWKACDRVVISDIDGTLTKSNAKGVIGTILTSSYERATHSGICHLLSGLVPPTSTKNAMSPIARTKTEITTSDSSTGPTNRVVYLTSRPIHLANKTRSFLSGLTQKKEQNSEESINNHTTAVGLPQGPILGFGGNLAKVLAMEVLSKTTQAFKAGQLEKHIALPFRRARNSNINNSENELFVAAFGNNLNDVQAYHKIGMDLHKIFMIDKNSRIVTFDKADSPTPSRENNHCRSRNSNEPQRSIGDESFPPHSWYKDTIGTVFENGYSDEKLLSCLGLVKK